MCSAPKAPPPPPAPPPDFADEQAALALDYQRQNQKQAFAGLNSSIVTGAGGVLGETRTSKNPRPKKAHTHA